MLPGGGTPARRVSTCHVVTAIRRTIALQEEIDALYPEVEKALIAGIDTT
ncbi:MAG: hypothetical protein Kow0063_15540 [Anaerolineae bacterium]